MASAATNPTTPDDAPPRTIDDIRVFLGPIPDDEYELRHKLRTARSVATFRVTSAQAPAARALLWMVCDAANQWVFTAADMATLKEASELCRRLLIVAEQAENLGLG